MLPRSVQKTLRLYRNRLAAAWFTDPPRRSGDDYRSRYGGRDRTDRDRERRRRRLKRRLAARVPLALSLLSVGVLVAGAVFAINASMSPRSRTTVRTFFQSLPRPSSSTSNSLFGRSGDHAVRPRYFMSSLGGRTEIDQNDEEGNDKVSNLEHPVTAGDAQRQAQKGFAEPNTRAFDDNSGTSRNGGPERSKHDLDNASQAASWNDSNTRTCYTNAASQSGVCVHVPLCMRHTSIVYVGDTLRCAAYTNTQGRQATMSRAGCVELERHVEATAQVVPVEHKPQSWLEKLEQDGNILWFKGDAVLVRLTSRAVSISHFAARILMLHHIMQHPRRYGLSHVSQVVIAAHQDVTQKIHYSKSWQHGLLAAVVHPNTMIYSQSTLESLLAAKTSSPSDRVNVFVSDGAWALANTGKVPCFRRVAVAAPAQPQLFLQTGQYPGVVDAHTLNKSMSHEDADSFRRQLFASLGYPRSPAMKGRVVYLHRASTRTLNAQGLTLLQETLTAACNSGGLTYQLVDVSGLTFPQQVAAVAGAAVVIGIHGTQMLNTLFLPRRAAVVELFPYRFANEMFAQGSGAGLHYASYQVVHGADYGRLAEFSGNVEECRKLSGECRKWYQSDNRAISFETADAVAVRRLLDEAMQYVRGFIGKEK